MKRSVKIRNIEARDRKAIMSITYRTGLFGEDLSHRGLVPDELIYSYLYSWYYITYEPENCFAAVVDDEIAGYIIGTPDTRRQRLRFKDLILPKINRRRSHLRSIGALYDDRYSRWMSGPLHDEISEYFEDIPQEVDPYPAHLHINVLPGYQRLGIGRSLMTAFTQRMREEGVPGIHLITTSFNEKAVPFYERCGYTLLKRIPFTTYLVEEGSGEALVFGIELK